MDLGNRFCIAKSSGTDLDTRHGKTGAETCKNRKGVIVYIFKDLARGALVSHVLNYGCSLFLALWQAMCYALSKLEQKARIDLGFAHYLIPNVLRENRLN